MKKWARALYLPNRPLEEGHYVTASREHIRLAERAAEEGMVLLKNERRVLPLSEGQKIAAFGKGIFDTVKGGGGTGDVYAPFVVTLAEALRKNGGALYEPLAEYYESDVKRQYRAGAFPGVTVEPAVPEDLLREARAFTDTALIALSRFSGEGWERQGGDFDNPEYKPLGEKPSMPRLAAEIYPDGDFYLTREEKGLIAAVKTAFPRVIVILNIGGIIDSSWIKNDDRITGALLMWQAGMSGANAAARILFGAVNPSGRLADTFAAKLEDYPGTEHFHDSPWYAEYSEDIYVGYRYFETIPGAAGRVTYPFGFGLSYTDFRTEMIQARETEHSIVVTVRVTNVGDRPGKEVVALYYQGPQGLLGRPARELGAFAKTGRLEPGACELLALEIEKAQMAAFDDLGKICAYAFLLEKGAYRFYLGCDVREAVLLPFAMELKEDLIVHKANDRLRPHSLAKRLRSDGSYEALPTEEPLNPDDCAFEKMRPGTEDALWPEHRGLRRYLHDPCYDRGAIPLIDVAEGRATMEAFMAQLSEDDLITLVGGTDNVGVANVAGFGGLPEYGVPAVMTADGSAGVRINEKCPLPTTAWPAEILLGCTWNTQILEEVGVAAGKETKENNFCILLAPGINLHRSPICGRNFEYFSEDPYLTGKLAAAEVRGIQSNGIAASIKHFWNTRGARAWSLT